jgi:hypothetical protein
MHVIFKARPSGGWSGRRPNDKYLDGPRASGHANRYGRKFVIVPATILAGVSLLFFLLASSCAWFFLAA